MREMPKMVKFSNNEISYNFCGQKMQSFLWNYYDYNKQMSRIKCSIVNAQIQGQGMQNIIHQEVDVN